MEIKYDKCHFTNNNELIICHTITNGKTIQECYDKYFWEGNDKSLKYFKLFSRTFKLGRFFCPK